MPGNDHSPRVTAVTGFYDVGRAAVDGRTAEQYLTWLNTTLQLPLPFVVFLDPAFDASGLALKPGDRVVRVAKNELGMFKHREEVEQIVATGETVNRRDIAFNLAEYGMIVMSKPELLKRAAAEVEADFLVWIDAGHCRFVPDLSQATLQVSATELEGMSIGLNTTYHLAQRMRLGRFPERMVGTCLAMMSAEDIIVAHDFAKEFSDRLDFMVETEWLPQGRWDNEQVAIGCLLFRGGLPGARILETNVGGGANTARWLFGAPRLRRRVPLYVAWRLLLDELRTRMTPLEACYLPDSFPQAVFRRWVQKNRA